MIYIISDLHGCFEKYMKMLDKIHLTPDDTLYVLGDVVDRGPDGIKILVDIYENPHVILLRGNHDHIAMNVLRCLCDPAANFKDDELIPLLQLWVSDEGDTTLKQFMSSSTDDKKKALSCLQHAKTHVEIEVHGKQYLLAHTVPEKEVMLASDKLSLDDYIMGEPDYDLQYYDDKILVTGHTPTGLIEKAYAGRIYIKNHHIAVDCGAVYKGGRLGCICLDTMEEFYV